jgi:hexosaminidase
MHIIPKPKSRQIQTGHCDISSGLHLPENFVNFVTGTLFANTLLVSSKEPDAIPVNFVTGTNLSLTCPEAYRLTITPHAIEISANDENGCRNALATLSQLAQNNCSYTKDSQTIACQTIEDYPDILWRGVMLDVSRGKIPNRTKFEELVQLLGTYKYNILQLYWEDCYILQSHPDFGKMNGYYDQAEVAWMDALCKKHGIELQPNIQSFSHMHGILRTPGYGHLSELDTLFSLAAGNPEVYRLLDDIFNEVLPWFSSRTVNLNMDEAYDLGTGYSKQAVAQKGSHQVFLEHIRTVAAIARKHGAKQIQIWGDKVAAYEGLQEELDDDIICIDWNYNPLEHFPSLEHFSAERKPFWVAPGTSSWNALFPRVQNASENITRFIAEGVKKGAEGVLMTHWGDYGHHQNISFSYHGFICAAEQAWNAGRTPLAEFDAAVAELFFADEHLERGFELLKQTNMLSSIQVGFKSQTIYAFFDDLFKGLTLMGDDHYPAIPESTFVGLRELGQAAVTEINLVPVTKMIVKELLHAARCIEFTGRKGLLSYEIKRAFAASAVNEYKILDWIQRIRLLYREFCALRQTFTELWDAEAVDIGREGALYTFDHAASRYAEAVIWLSTQRIALLAGSPVDTQMETYTSADNYRTLWTGNTMNLWDRAYPWR